MTREIRFAILNLTNSVCQIAIYHIELPHLSKVRIRPSVSIFSAKLFRSMLFLFATLFHPSDVERSLVTSDKLLNLKGSVFSLTEKKWQYCQKIFVKREFKEPFGFLVLSDSRTLLPHFMVTRFVSFLFSFENSLLKICLSSKECLFLHMK